MGSLRQAATIATLQLHRMSLDRSHLLWLVALPLLLILVLGASLTPLMGGSFVPARPFSVAVVDGAMPARRAVTAALTEATEYVRPTPFPTAEAARRAALHREVDVAVVVPDGFPLEPIAVIGAPGAFAVEVVAAVIREVLAADDSRLGAATGVVPVPVAATLVSAARPDADAHAGASEAWREASAYRYYSVGMAVFFALIAAHTALTIHADDRRGALGDRVRALGVRPATHRVGGVLASTAFVLVIFAVLAVVTWGLFGVGWGSPVAWFALTAVGAVAFVGVALALLAILPRPGAYQAGGMVVLYAMAMLGGSLSPLHVLPEILTDAFAWLPTRALSDGYFALGVGGGWADLGEPLTRLALGAAAAFAVASALFAVRGARGEG